MDVINADDTRMWREYCAIVQLPMQVFLDIQNTLLTEQMDLAAKADWFKPFSGGRSPKTVDEFRRDIPLHTWKDYISVLQPDAGNGTAGDVHCWVHTSWCHGSWKRVPWVRRFFDAQCRHIIASLMMSVARFEGDVRLNKNFRVLPVLPETPFASAWLATGVIQRDLVSSLLGSPGDEGDGLTMSQRIQAGLRRSLEPGVDCVIGMSSTLLLARREFERMVDATSFRQLLFGVGARAASRWAWAGMRRMANAKPWEPKLLLAPKSVITWGADTSFLTPTLEAHWGAPVFQFYASSEAGIIAMQDWRRQGLVPLPTSVFLEFLPAGAEPDNDATVLLDQLEDGGLYEPVVTSFYGMPFLRFRQGDLVRVVGRNEHDVPMFEVHSRADDIIDLGSIARIDRATLAEALEVVGIKDGQWTARKEYEGNRVLMSLYVESDPEHVKDLRGQLETALGKIDPHYREARYTLRYPLLKVVAVQGAEVASSMGSS